MSAENDAQRVRMTAEALERLFGTPREDPRAVPPVDEETEILRLSAGHPAETPDEAEILRLSALAATPSKK